jgi:hypothetical protein
LHAHGDGVLLNEALEVASQVESPKTHDMDKPLVWMRASRSIGSGHHHLSISVV